jgi:hypothetical protein
MVEALGRWHGRHARGMYSTDLAPRPWDLFMIGQQLMGQPCAQHGAMLGVTSSRSSSVSRGIRSAAPKTTNDL